MKALCEFVETAAGEWTFEDVADGQPLPTFLFDDGTDLGYVLDWLRRKGDERLESLSPVELILL